MERQSGASAWESQEIRWWDHSFFMKPTVKSPMCIVITLYCVTNAKDFFTYSWFACGRRHRTNKQLVAVSVISSGHVYCCLTMPPDTGTMAGQHIKILVHWNVIHREVKCLFWGKWKKGFFLEWVGYKYCTTCSNCKLMINYNDKPGLILHIVN